MALNLGGDSFQQLSRPAEKPGGIHWLVYVSEYALIFLFAGWVDVFLGVETDAQNKSIVIGLT